MTDPMAADGQRSKDISELEADIEDVRANLRSLARRSRELVREGKTKRDQGLIAKIRRQLGLG